MVAGARAKIMIVDDDETLLRATRTMLELEGYEVFTRSRALGTSKEFLQISPDLLLLDVYMPDLSGGELVTILQRNELTSKVPVVFYSGANTETLASLVAKHGVAGYIPKGDPKVLRSRVAGYLARFTSHPHGRGPDGRSEPNW